MEISLYNEFKRKAIHLFALSVPIGYYLLPREIALLILIPITLGSIIVDIVRLRNLPLAGFLNWLLGPILREHESWDLTGSSYILSASVLCIMFLNKKVAIAAIAYIILGDIAAAIIGRAYGRTKIGKKSLEGSLAFLGVGLLIALFLPGLPFWVGAIGALVATAVEALNIPLNDNLSVPLASGLIMEILILL